MGFYYPISLLDRQVLNQLLIKGNQYFIRQKLKPDVHYFAALDECLLILSHYSTKEDALKHYTTIEQVPHRKLYDITNEVDVQNLYVMADQPKGYKIFTTWLDPTTWQAPPNFQEKLYRYFVDRGFMLLKENVIGFPVFRNGLFLILVKTSYGTLATPFNEINWS